MKTMLTALAVIAATPALLSNAAIAQYGQERFFQQQRDLNWIQQQEQQRMLQRQFEMQQQNQRLQEFQQQQQQFYYEMQRQQQMNRLLEQLRR